MSVSGATVPSTLQYAGLAPCAATTAALVTTVSGSAILASAAHDGPGSPASARLTNVTMSVAMVMPFVNQVMTASARRF
jgi:hypothetical protein